MIDLIDSNFIYFLFFKNEIYLLFMHVDSN
jgi:hypothetical protein